MMPCSPAITFCSIVGHARRHTAGRMGPSTMDRSNFQGDEGPDIGMGTRTGVYYGRLLLRACDNRAEVQTPNYTCSPILLRHEPSASRTSRSWWLMSWSRLLTPRLWCCSRGTTILTTKPDI